MNLHDDAVKFVLKHKCANTTPIDLTMLEYTEKCMNYGAIVLCARMQAQATVALNELVDLRTASQSHPETRKPIPYDPTIKT